MTLTLETARLRLRPFVDSDFDAYARMCADPEVMCYLAERRPLSRAEAWRQMAMLLGHWELRGYGMWVVEDRTTGAFLGRVGFWNPEGWPGFEIGWVLDRPHWGRGFATEAARAALNHAFVALGKQRVISLIDPENSASIRVAERLGETRMGTFPVHGREAVVYGIERPKWLAGGAPAQEVDAASRTR